MTGLITEENVSWQSKPWIWWNPLATNLALNLLIEPSAFSFTLKTHLQPMVCLLGGKGTKSQVLFFKKASYSCCIAVSQSLFAKVCLLGNGIEHRGKQKKRMRKHSSCFCFFWFLKYLFWKQFSKFNIIWMRDWFCWVVWNYFRK